MKNLHEILPAVWFYGFGAFILISALCVVGLKNVVHCAMFLGATFICVAALYLVLNAEFIAVVQVLIYVGAITVLILFAVMLSQKYLGGDIKQHNTQSIPAAILVALFLITVVPVIARNWAKYTAPAKSAQGTAQAIGELLLQPYVLPFEVASLLLLAAMIGAIIIARRDEEQ